MRFTTKVINRIGSFLQLQIPQGMDVQEETEKLKSYVSKGKEIVVEIKHQRRNKDANAKCWALCGDIARCLNKQGYMITGEDVYRKAVKECGFYTTMSVKTEAVSKFQRLWSCNGIGWFALAISELRTQPGYSLVAAYYGSSQYDTQEMSVLIDNLVQEADALGLETIDPEEKAMLLDEWSRSHDEN